MLSYNCTKDRRCIDISTLILYSHVVIMRRNNIYSIVSFYYFFEFEGIIINDITLV